MPDFSKLTDREKRLLRYYRSIEDPEDRGMAMGFLWKLAMPKDEIPVPDNAEKIEATLPKKYGHLTLIK